MTPEFAVALLGAFLLLLVSLYGLLYLAERRSPQFSRWLDENVGQPGPWS